MARVQGAKENMETIICWPTFQSMHKKDNVKQSGARKTFQTLMF